MMNDSLNPAFSVRLQGSHRLLALCLLFSLNAFAVPNDVDDEGRLIAAPDETDLVERGYLFYPQRVLPKPVKDKAVTQVKTAVGDSPDMAAQQPMAATPEGEHGAAPEQIVAANDVHASDDHGVSAQPVSVVPSHGNAKPAAGTVIVQPLEPVKLQAASASTVHATHANAEAEQPVLSKAEQAKADRAKAELARAEKLKEMQAKAELAKQERAKAAAARAEKIKEEQAKAELARAERAKTWAQTRATKAQEDLAKAIKKLEELSGGAKPATEEVKATAPAADAHADADPATVPAAKESKNEVPAKAAQVSDAHSAEKHADTAPAKAQASAKDEHAKDEHAKDMHGDSQPAHDSHDAHGSSASAKPASSKADKADPATAPVTARQKLLLTNDKRVVSAKD